MSPKRRTSAYLQLADQNRTLATQMLNLSPPQPKWAAVVAFYAAVNYVGAYLKEIHNREAQSHPDRRNEIAKDLLLQKALQNYDRLFNAAWSARYEPTFSLTVSGAQELIDTDLHAIAQPVQGILQKM
jgi:hypothetical protein